MFPRSFYFADITTLLKQCQKTEFFSYLWVDSELIMLNYLPSLMIKFYTL